MIDKSYDFKRKSLYWYSVLNSDSDSVTHGYSDDTFVDRYSSISAILFNRLLSFESVVSPYTILNNEHTYKSNPYGNLVLPKKTNLNSFIRSKRTAFNKIGIKSIVHDTNVIGDMINQMEGSLKNGTYSTDKNSALIEHREGINSCLKYVYQIVKDDVENYERFRLKSESTLNNNLKVMTENLSEIFNLDESGTFDSIPNSYLSHFFPSQESRSDTSYDNEMEVESLNHNNQHINHQHDYQSHDSHAHHQHTCSDVQHDNHLQDGQHYPSHSDSGTGYSTGKLEYTSSSNGITSSGLNPSTGFNTTHTSTSNIVGITIPTSGNLGSLKYNKGSYNISTSFVDQSEMEDKQVSGTLVQQHAKMVSSINDQLKAAELRTINTVQERIAEISSMFVKFTGAVEGQNESFLQISENVQESLINIEKTQETLKKTSKEGLPFYHRILCYSLAGLSVILLFIDYLKSSKGSYLF